MQTIHCKAPHAAWRTRAHCERAPAHACANLLHTLQHAEPDTGATPAAELAACRAPPPAPSAVLLSAFIAVLREWEPGLVAIIAAVLEAQLTFSFSFTHLKDVCMGPGVTKSGRRLTCTRYGYYDWAIATPPLRRSSGVRVTVHRGGGGVAVGVIGTTEPGVVKHGNCFHHATAHAWYGHGHVHLAGQRSRRPGDTGGWPSGGWKTGDVAALMLDPGARTLTLKHRRLGKVFVIVLPDTSDWFVNVCVFCQGESVEVQPMGKADFDAFLH